MNTETKDVSRAKDLWYNNSYEQLNQLVEQLITIGEIECNEADPPEWYSVNSWLADRLREHGEIVINYQGLHIWGRTTTGQVAWIDYVIQDIYDNLKSNIGG